MTLPKTVRSKGEYKFIHEYTRTLLIEWGKHQIAFGVIFHVDFLRNQGNKVFLDHAINKGWVTKDGTKLTSAGFDSAAGRLKAMK